LILKKLEELKKQNRNIEEIYKYTNDIILEEENEEEGEGDSYRSRSVIQSMLKNDSMNISREFPNGNNTINKSMLRM
jgi:hypothetical protein